MKNIVICCDGTSNDFGDKNSNVVKLFSVLVSEQKKQVIYYDPGVGTPSTYDSFNPLVTKTKYILGQAFGYGLTSNIIDAYLFLMSEYEEGDRIFIFGFSRGAYTARAIAGILYKCGLLQSNLQNLVHEAMRIYKEKNNWRIAREFRNTFGRKCPIHFLGLWDTVTSVGWIYDPVTLDSTTRNPSVSIVRHAISIDERRAFFKQNLWKQHQKAPNQDIKQVWFAGVHSDVGGSYARDKSALSNIALEWMLVEAKANDILIGDETKAKTIVNDILNPHLKDQNKSLTAGWLIGEIWPKWVKVPPGVFSWKPAYLYSSIQDWGGRPYLNLKRRRVMSKNATLHESVILRLKNRADYRPSNLMQGRDIATVEKEHEIEKWEKF